MKRGIMEQENHPVQTTEITKYGKFVALLIGVALIGAGIFTYFRNNELARVCTEKTTATVVGMREEFEASADTEGTRYVYYPVVEYQANGSTVKGEIPNPSNPPLYSVNDKIDIFYNPNKTSEFMVAGENQSIFWIILTGLGAVFVIAGIFLFFKK